MGLRHRRRGKNEMKSLRIFVVLTLSSPSGLGLAAQSSAPAKSQAEINEEAQEAYRAGTAAATSNDLKTAEMQFETVVRLVPRR